MVLTPRLLLLDVSLLNLLSQTTQVDFDLLSLLSISTNAIVGTLMIIRCKVTLS